MAIRNNSQWLLLSLMLTLGYSTEGLTYFTYTFQDIVKIINDENITSIETLLPKLPKSFRSNFTLVKDSHSLQKSDPMFPRVIMFTHDASLACTFNGHEKFEGFDTLECYQFNAKTNKFEFREIEFPSKRNGLKKTEVSKLNMRVNGTISCTACHGADPRPNWENYHRWPRVYGGRDDSFHSDAYKLDGKFVLDDASKEKEEYLKFKKYYWRNPRYSQLQFGKKDISPYNTVAGDGDYSLRPNLRLTEGIKVLMAKRNAQFLLAQPKSMQLEFLAAVAQCNGSSATAFLSKITNEIFWTPYFSSLDKDCKECVSSYNTFDYGPSIGGPFPTGAMNSHVAKIIIDSFIKNGEADLKPLAGPVTHFYGRPFEPDNFEVSLGSAPADLVGLNKACGLLEDKIKAVSQQVR